MSTAGIKGSATALLFPNASALGGGAGGTGGGPRQLRGCLWGPVVIAVVPQGHPCLPPFCTCCSNVGGGGPGSSMQPLHGALQGWGFIHSPAPLCVVGHQPQALPHVWGRALMDGGVGDGQRGQGVSGGAGCQGLRGDELGLKADWGSRADEPAWTPAGQCHGQRGGGTGTAGRVWREAASVSQVQGPGGWDGESS